MSTPEEEKEILEDIEKTGYPLEVDISTWLIEDGWSVIPEWSYFDGETGKPRAIDVLADYVLKGLEDYVTPLLLVECKTSKNAWVFYSLYPKTSKDRVIGIDELRLSSISYTMNHLLQLEGKVAQISMDDEVQLLQRVHFFDPKLPRSFSCHVVRRRSRADDPDDFYRAILELRGAYTNLERFPGKPIMMAIVLRGKMFELWRRGSDSKLIPRSHIMFQTFAMMSEKTRLFPPVIVDVVSDTYFRDYLRVIKKDFKALRPIYDRLAEKLPQK
jgi:hypothetical protein